MLVVTPIQSFYKRSLQCFFRCQNCIHVSLHQYRNHNLKLSSELIRGSRARAFNSGNRPSANTCSPFVLLNPTHSKNKLTHTGVIQQKVKQTTSATKSKTIKKWTLPVECYGRINIFASFGVSIAALDPQKHSEQDKAELVLFAAEESSAILEECLCELDEQGVTFKCMSDGATSLGHHLVASVPMKHSVKVEVSGRANVSVQGLESDSVDVTTHLGSCTFSGVKALDVRAVTAGGDVTSQGSLVGNSHISVAGSGAIGVGKLQGQHHKLTAASGPVTTGAVYCETCDVASGAGDVTLGQVHGHLEVRSEGGHVSVDSLEGSLTVDSQSGNTTVGLTQANHLSLSSHRGDIDIKLSPGQCGHVSLRGVSVDLAPEVAISDEKRHCHQEYVSVEGDLVCEGSSRGQEATMSATTEEGVVRLSTKSWFESLGVGRQ